MVRTLPSFRIQLCLLLTLLGASTAAAQRYSQQGTTPVAFDASVKFVNEPPPAARPSSDSIIRNFVATETKLREALVQFSFKREVVLQTVGAKGQVTGEYLRNSIFVLDDQGQRIEEVVYHPKSTLEGLKITKEDIQDLAGSQLFGLELANLDSYNLAYAGEESVNGKLMYLIAVSPRQVPDAHRMRERFFVGRFWIDLLTFQPIYLEGTTEPHGKQRFPAFKTARQTEIENLRFPSSTFADDVLRFPHTSIHYRINVRYYDFKRFAGRVKIVDVD